MAEVGTRLAASGFLLARNAAGPVDYYRITASESGEAVWIVMRHSDGIYHLYSGMLELLRTGTRLRDALLPDWLAIRA